MEIDDRLNTSLEDLIARNKNEGRPPSSAGQRETQRKRAREPQQGTQPPLHILAMHMSQSTGSTVITVARRVYVGNLDWSVTWQDLKDHFRSIGNVLYAEVLTEGAGGRSKGCGIVEFSHPEEAARAIEEMQNSTLRNRLIFVREDREDKELLAATGGGGRGGRARGHGGEPSPKAGRSQSYGGVSTSVTVGRKVFVTGLARSTTWQSLKDHFRPAGSVVHAVVLQNDDGSSRGCGVVDFQSASDALRAISQLSNSTLDGSQIHVREYRDDPRGGPAAGGSQEGAMRGGGREGEVQIVVHGLPYAMAWQGLKDLVREHSLVEAARTTITMGGDGRSKGWGLVLLRNMQDAQAAIQALNGLNHEGRVITAKLDSKTK